MNSSGGNGGNGGADGMSDPAVSSWLGGLAWERGLSASTREAYARDVRTLASFLSERRGAVEWGRVSPSDISEFLDSEARHGLGVATRARRLAAVRSFFAWLRDEGRIAADPAVSVALPKRRRVLPHVISADAAARLMDAPSPDTPEGVRDRAILELLYGCGLRESEVATLPIDAIRFHEGMVRVRGKGGKDRFVPLGSRAEAAVRAWLGPMRDSFRPAPGEPRVFVDRKGRPLSRAAVWGAVKRHVRAAGLPKEVSPHWLRHSFATHLLAGGAPIRVIQELLGHADIGTTQIYTHVDAERLASVVKSFHPRS